MTDSTRRIGQADRQKTTADQTGGRPYRVESTESVDIMKLTLDHNCIINAANQTTIGKRVQALASDETNSCYVVDIGASEMREKGVFPDHYDRFVELLTLAQLEHLPRLSPPLILDVTFFDRCVLTDEDGVKLAEAIDQALFSGSRPIDIGAVGLDSPDGKKGLNRLCDVHSLWCHIQNGNDVFVTTDKNFTKQSKMSKLLTLGAGRICHPNQL